nr:FtsW/RodA/SpoVE family cell cycle protein [uncultured Agathobaculum sp.]
MASTTRQARSPRRPDPRRRVTTARPALRPDRAPVPRDAAMMQTHAKPPARTHVRPRVRAHVWDVGVFGSVLLLLVIGLIALFSASYSNALFYQGSATYFISRQGANAAAGVVAMIVISKISYKLYARFHKELMILSLVLLVLVITPLGTASKGAQRWLFGFQPSELAKITVIVCFSYWIARDTQGIRTFKGLIKPYGFLLAAYVVLLFLEPHTSAMMIICGLGVVILVAGGMRLWYFGPIIVVGAGILTGFYFAFEHVQERFSVWLDPFSNMQGEGWQGAMSQIAIGSGGLLGRGLGKGMQKHLYLPEPQNDFIFSSWCEEMGLVGALLVLLLFAYLIFRGFRIARAAPDKFSCLMATGITAKLAIQTLMNLFVITGIIPVTGASLPFFSYGGTALLMQMGEMGILLNISRYARVDTRTEE